ncbi:MAG: hypothetical protein CMJ83_13935 [Planctomycetes bacterium]|nr:hypothetical protein [Planctomycetota bacterium]
MRPHFLDLEFADVRRHLDAGGHLERGPKIAEQAYRGVHQKLAPHFHDVPGLSHRKVARLDSAFEYSRPLRLQATHPTSDGSVRYAFRLDDDAVIESVLIKRHDRWSLCVSSQVGCALACTFCATGQLGFSRSLATREIVDQALQVSRHAGCRLDGIVFMGMGEPLNNERAVLRACRIFGECEGLQISPRKITISTVGIVPAIRRFADAGHRMNLVFSIGAAAPEKRARLMPVEKSWDFFQLIDAIRYYATSRPGRLVTLEYVAIKDLTMGDDDLAAIREHLSGLPIILNVIPFNPVPGSGLEAPTRDEVKAWTAGLRPMGFPVKVRYSAGSDRYAGCGQLGAAVESPGLNDARAAATLRCLEAPDP